MKTLERPRVGHTTLTFDADGDAVVSATSSDDWAKILVTVGDGVTPADPTEAANDGEIVGRSGDVDTGVHVTTGNDAVVKVVPLDSDGNPGTVQTVRQRRELGAFQKDATTRSIGGVATEETLETITVPGGKLGSSGVLRLTAFIDFDGTNGDKLVRVRWGGITVTFLSIPAASQPLVWLEMLLSNDGASSQDFICKWSVAGSAPEKHQRTTIGLDSSVDRDLTIIGERDSTGDGVSLEFSLVEYLGTP